MKLASALAALFLATLAACVDPAAEATTSADVTAASCTQVTTCDLVCSEIVFNKIVRFGTDRVHQICDDGSDIVLHQNPCGEACR